MTLQSLIDTHGYWLLALGCLHEGETILLLAGFAAHRGYLDPWAVFGIASLAGFAGDQFYFFLGCEQRDPADFLQVQADCVIGVDVRQIVKEQVLCYLLRDSRTTAHLVNVVRFSNGLAYLRKIDPVMAAEAAILGNDHRERQRR